MLNRTKQRGVTLVEMMIGLALSMIVVSSMVGLMSSSMGSATRIIQMTQLTDELRNAMSMVTRDVRRANYSAHAAYCYANSDCGVDGTTTVTDITVNNAGNCMIFDLDRKQNNFASGDEAPGGFRLATRADGAGFIEMWVGGSGMSCADATGQNDDDWLPLTDPNFVDVLEFSIVAETFEDSVEEGGGNWVNQRTNEIKIAMLGQLQLDDTISRRIEDTIKVRNDYIWRSTSAP